MYAKPSTFKVRSWCFFLLLSQRQIICRVSNYLQNYFSNNYFHLTILRAWKRLLLWRPKKLFSSFKNFMADFLNNKSPNLCVLPLLSRIIVPSLELNSGCLESGKVFKQTLINTFFITFVSNLFDCCFSILCVTIKLITAGCMLNTRHSPSLLVV